ncbi:hypothetical protein UYO_3105 [Lachnospiraceae bacterium JC7]|nr:hypothetical protein UYO_3105 [Lachnospiraceae bacterium JC7]
MYLIKFIFWLGTISLPVYMVQNFTREIVHYTLNKRADIITIFFYEIFVTICFGVGLYYMIRLLKNMVIGYDRNKKKNKESDTAII